MSFAETLMMIKGHESRVNVQWQQTRLLIYTISCTVTEPEKRGEVYDLFYLPGDPTPEQRMEEVRKVQEESARRVREFNEQLRRELVQVPRSARDDKK